MSDTLTVTGVVGTDPRVFTTSSGVQVTSFRVASSQRYFDRSAGEWRDPGSNWFTVSCFRQLAEHVAASIQKGDRVIVSGRLRLKPWSNDQREGINVDLEAEAVGHDLQWGTSVFARSTHTSESSSEESAATQTPTEGRSTAAERFLPDNSESEGWPTVAPAEVA